MALGSNLKKQKLIPEVPKKEPRKKTPVTKSALKTSPKKIGKKTKKEKLIQNKTKIENQISQKDHDIKQELRNKFNSEVDELKSEKLQLVIFQLANDLYAIEMKYIKEVVVTPEISRVPNAPEHILGVAEVRDIVIPIIDLEIKYQINSNTLRYDNSYTMIISTLFGDVGLLVNEVPYTYTIAGDLIEKISDIMSDSILNENFVKALIIFNKKMIMLLDVNEMISDEKLKVN